MFGHADPDTLIPISSLRLGKLRSHAGETYLHSFFSLRVSDLDKFADVIERSQRLGHEATYFAPVTLHSSACSTVDPEWQGREVSFLLNRAYVAQQVALVLDLDVGRSPHEAKSAAATMTAAHALSRLVTFIEQGALPPPTFIAESGRGLYLMYVIDPPLKPSAANREQVMAVVDRWLEIVADFAPDVAASRTPHHVFKVPGGPHDVRYFAVEMAGAPWPRRFSLAELQDVLNVEVSIPAPQPPRRSPPTSEKRRSWLHVSAHLRHRRDDLLMLAKHRGARLQGDRHNLMMYYATAIRFIVTAKYGLTAAGKECATKIARRRTIRFNRTLAQPLPESEIEGLFDSFLPKPHRSDTIVTVLEITAAEKLACGPKVLIPDSLRKRLAADRTARKEAKARLRATVLKMRADGVSVAEIVNRTGVGRSTVYKWLPKERKAN